MNEQLHTFMVTVVIGAGLGVMYDFYRVGKRAVRLNSLLTAVGDLLYWLVATVVVFFALLYCNWGELRFYVFLGLFSGAILYFRLFSSYLVSILVHIGRAFRQIVRFVAAVANLLVVKPVAWALKIILYPFHLVHRTVRHWLRGLRPKP